jgi:hypothetical protein
MALHVGLGVRTATGQALADTTLVRQTIGELVYTADGPVPLGSLCGWAGREAVAEGKPDKEGTGRYMAPLTPRLETSGSKRDLFAYPQTQFLCSFVPPMTVYNPIYTQTVIYI